MDKGAHPCGNGHVHDQWAGVATAMDVALAAQNAMAAAKANGKRFGNPRIGELNKARKNKARQYSSPIAPIVLPLRAKGMTYQQIATTLNEMKIKTPQGGSYFYPTQVNGSSTGIPNEVLYSVAGSVS